MRRFALLSWSFLALAAGPLAADPARPVQPQAAEAAAFFESRVRPVLVEHCYSCHGEKKQKGDLRLDSRAALLKGGDTGPVVVPGEPDKSALIRAVRYADDVRMPPKGKLPPDAVEALTTWVRAGAVWPDAERAAGVKGPTSADDQARTHWAFQSVRKPAVPAVLDTAWPATPVDAFVLNKLEGRKLSPSAPADRRTLVRRVTYDLTGLPPTPEEVDAALGDASPNWFEKVVDRLLASPAYGERWGRHWLDLARYADTKGYVFQEERRYPFAYTYRDYVIRAFNEDLRYDRFVVEQIAADRLALGEDKRPLAALGFLTLGRRFLNNVHDIIDDRIDVVSRGLLGLTVTCARCHDHKYDPIPTADYYSLHGVFASTVEPKDLPLIAKPERTPAVEKFERELQARRKQADDFLQAKLAETTAKMRSQSADYLLASLTAARRPGAGAGEARPGELNFAVVRRWQAFLQQKARASDPVFGPWQDLAKLPAAEFAAKAPAVVTRIKKDPRINRRVAEALPARPTALKDVAGAYGKVFEEALKDASRAGDPGWEAVRKALQSPESPFVIPAAEARRFLDRAARNKFNELQQ
jgi:hypothetical protein